MSAFIVSETTMWHAVTALDKNNAPSEQLTELGRRLYAMNLDAVQQRYPNRDKDSEAFYVPEFTYYYPMGTSEVQQLKSLICLRYQCSEGNVAEKWPEYKMLTDEIHERALRLVGEMPEYRAAKWDGQ